MSKGLKLLKLATGYSVVLRYILEGLRLLRAAVASGEFITLLFKAGLSCTATKLRSRSSFVFVKCVNKLLAAFLRASADACRDGKGLPESWEAIEGQGFSSGQLRVDDPNC